MGRAMPGWDVEILDEDEQPVTPGERERFPARARTNPHYPLGYRNRPRTRRRRSAATRFHTKDAAEQDEDGYWYSGRADDVIIRPATDRAVRGRVGLHRAPRRARGGGRRIAR